MRNTVTLAIFSKPGGRSKRKSSDSLNNILINPIKFQDWRCCTTQIANGTDWCEGTRFHIRWTIDNLFASLNRMSIFRLMQRSCTTAQLPFAICKVLNIDIFMLFQVNFVLPITQTIIRFTFLKMVWRPVSLSSFGVSLGLVGVSFTGSGRATIWPSSPNHPFP